MGFDSHITAEVVYGAALDMPAGTSIWHLLKNLALFTPRDFSCLLPASMPGDCVGIIETFDSVLVDRAHVDPSEFKRPQQHLTEIERRFHYNRRILHEDGIYEEDGIDVDFNLTYNYPELLVDAFAQAADRVLGPGHGLALQIERDGCSFEPDAESEELVFLLVHAPSAIRPRCAGERAGWAPRHSTNVPWGVQLTRIPATPPTGAACGMDKLSRALGMPMAAPPLWHLLTTASGG